MAHTLLEQAKTDRFFSNSLKFWTLDQLVEAGLFVDNLSCLDYNLDSDLTPIDKFLNLEDNSVVIITTGGFAPPHLGHIELLVQAKEILEANGLMVSGAYLTPSHDSYVSTKHANALCGADRVDLCEKITWDYDWIDVDAWPALGAPLELNFTEVIDRTEKFLENKTGKRIRVAYVYGSDNAFFSRAFVSDGIGVCIARHGSEKKMDSARQEIIGNVYFSSNNKFSQLSSTKVRTVG